MTEPQEAHMRLLADHECSHGFLPDDEHQTCRCWENHDLQVRLDRLRAGRVPLPMSEGEAIVHAVRLRTVHNIPYTVIAQIMALYHGQFFAEQKWRKACRARGAVPVYRGNTSQRIKDAA